MLTHTGETLQENGKLDITHHPIMYQTGMFPLSQINWITLVKEEYAIIMSFCKILPNKNVFFNNYIVGIFLFATAILIMVTSIVMYILCNHMKIKSLVTSLALQQIKEVGVVAKQESVTLALNIYLKDTMVHHFIVRFINFGLSAFCHSKLKKTKAVQRTLVLQCS